MSTGTTFILADNQSITRKGMRSFITEVASDSGIIEATGKRELIEALTENGNGIVILDYALFDINGTEDLAILSKRFSKATWLMFSGELSSNFIRRMGVERNVSMLLKDCREEEIRLAIACAVRKERFLCRQIAEFLVEDRSHEQKQVLTSTEIEILKLIAKGLSAKEIAAERVSSVHTVITHKKNIFRKIGVNNVYEATRYALRAGYADMVEYYI